MTASTDGFLAGTCPLIVTLRRFEINATVTTFLGIYVLIGLEMIGEIHHVPGRLRLKALELKRNPELARRAEVTLRRQRGVRSAEVNGLTGSLLVYYDTELVDGQSVLALIRNELSLRVERRQKQTQTAPAIDQKVANALFWWALEKVVERSVPLMIGAIL